MKRKVVCIFGSFEGKDFVLEPYIEGDEEEFNEEEIFWIDKIKGGNKK